MKVEMKEKDKYPEIEVLGAYSGGRDGFGTMDCNAAGMFYVVEVPPPEGFVALGSEVGFRQVEKIESIELFVELLNGKRSAESFTIKGNELYRSHNPENSFAIDVFTRRSVLDYCYAYEGDDYGDGVLTELRKCAEAMCKEYPEIAGRWRIVDSLGRRVFVRGYEESGGFITSFDEEDDDELAEPMPILEMNAADMMPAEDGGEDLLA